MSSMSSFANVLVIIFLLVPCILAATPFAVVAPTPITAGSTVSITWSASSNPGNLPFSVLLKQGNPSASNFVVNILTSGNTPNSGTFSWTVPTTLPSGNNYYIRLQTGLPSDWSGGLGTTAPTSNGAYGLSNIVIINSAIPSTTYLNPTTSIAPSTPVSTTSSITSPTTSNPSSAVPSSSPGATPSAAAAIAHHSHPSAGVIAGPIVGGLAGLALLAALLAFLVNAANSKVIRPTILLPAASLSTLKT